MSECSLGACSRNGSGGTRPCFIKPRRLAAEGEVRANGPTPIREARPFSVPYRRDQTPSHRAVPSGRRVRDTSSVRVASLRRYVLLCNSRPPANADGLLLGYVGDLDETKQGPPAARVHRKWASSQ